MPTRELLSSRSDEYRSFVVRLSRSNGHAPWRLTVEVVSTRQQIHLRDVDALAQFFAKQMSADEPADVPADTESA